MAGRGDGLCGSGHGFRLHQLHMAVVEVQDERRDQAEQQVGTHQQREDFNGAASLVEGGNGCCVERIRIVAGHCQRRVPGQAQIDADSTVSNSLTLVPGLARNERPLIIGLRQKPKGLSWTSSWPPPIRAPAPVAGPVPDGVTAPIPATWSCWAALGTTAGSARPALASPRPCHPMRFPVTAAVLPGAGGRLVCAQRP